MVYPWNRKAKKETTETEEETTKTEETERNNEISVDDLPFSN